MGYQELFERYGVKAPNSAKTLDAKQPTSSSSSNNGTALSGNYASLFASYGAKPSTNVQSYIGGDDSFYSDAQKRYGALTDFESRFSSLIDNYNSKISQYGSEYGKQKSNKGIFYQANRDFDSIKQEVENLLGEIDALDLDEASRLSLKNSLEELIKGADSASLDARSRIAAYNNPATQSLMKANDNAAYSLMLNEKLQNSPQMALYNSMLDAMGGEDKATAASTAPYFWQFEESPVRQDQLLGELTQRYSNIANQYPRGTDTRDKYLGLATDTQNTRDQLSAYRSALVAATEDEQLNREIERLKAIDIDTAISTVQQTIDEKDAKVQTMSKYWDEQAWMNDENAEAPDYEEYQRELAELEKYQLILDRLYADKDAERASPYTVLDSEIKANFGHTYNPSRLFDRINESLYEDPYAGDAIDYGLDKYVEANMSDDVKTSSYPIAQRPEHYMTQEERDTYNTLYFREGEESANAYFERIKPVLEARGAQQVMAEAKQFTEDYPNWAGLQARGSNALKPITSAFMIGDILSGNGINENSAANLNTSVANLVDSYVPQVTNYTGDAQILGRDLDQFLYGTVGSVIDSVVRTLTASFLGGGGSGATLRENIKGLSRATGALMSLEVFPTVVLQEKEKGRSDTEAVVLGTLRAAIEGLTEKYSIEMLFSPSRNFGTQLLKGAVAEGSEEIAATVLNGAVDIIAGDKDNIIAEFERRVAMGINPSEALADILLERGKSTLVDGLSGALSGLLFTAGGGMGGAFNTTSKEANRVSESTESAQILVEQALAENPNSKVALNAQKQLAAGKNISAKTVQKLINENESIYRRDDQQKVTEAVIKELTNRGEVTAARETAAAIAKAVSGENLSDGELRSIEGSVFGTQIYNEITGKAEGGEWLNQLREDLDILKIAPQTKKQEPRAKRVTMRNADATTKSGERVQILGLQAQDDGTVSIKVRGTNGAESVVAASELNMSEESQDLVEGVAEFKGAAPAVYAAYMPTNDVDIFLKDAAFVSTMAQSVAASNKNDGSAMLRYLKDSRLVSNLADVQIDTIFEATLAEAKKTLSSAQGKKTSGKGNFTWNVETRSEESLRGREATAVRFMRNLAAIYPDIDIEIFESDVKNGLYQGEQGSYRDGKIRIDLNAGKYSVDDQIESAMLRTLSHELTHHLQRTAPKQYAALKAFITEHLAEWNGGKELDDLISAKQRRAKGGLSYAAAMDEVVADACEMMLKNSKAIQQLATENKSLFAKIRDFVKKFLSDLRRAFAGVEANDAAARYLKKFETEMQQLWDEAFTASVENSRMTSTAIPAANTLMNPMQESQFSLREDEKFMQNAINANKAKQLVPYRVMAAAQDARSAIAAIMRDPKLQDALNLPADLMGKTYFPDGAYNGTEENTLVCPRSMGAEELLDAVSEMIGRPLTVDDCIEVSQFIAGSEFKPECEYCYVATDRKAYRAFLKSYVEQRDSVIEKYKSGMNKAALYEEFLDGRKDTKNMRDRFNLWIKVVDQNLPMMQASDLANVNKLMHDIIEPGIRDQVKDAMKYAQSASWAKKRVGYTAYNGHILKWSQTKINQLNKGFGLRMYSFSDFSPAFILENMQMITDAAVRGLKMMAYNKEADFVKIFAPTGININVSTFGFERNGVVAENAMQGVSWKEAQELRAKYPNVGITFVATNDNLVNWALEQDWIDVVIPYHLVRTGKQVAERLGFTNYTSESGDIKASDWTKGRDMSSIPPTMHNNDKQTYLNALEENHLQPRFKRWLDHPNYMKLVNETRLSSLESKPVQPKFDLESAKKSLIGMIKDGGYFQHIGGSVDRMYEIASGIAEKLDGGTQYSERDYEAAEIARLEQRIEALEQGKADAFLAGQMRTARQAGKETRRLEEKINTLKGKLDAAKQTATDTRKATAAERKAADLRAKNLEAQIKKLTKEAEARGFLAGEMRVARQAGAEIRNREEQIRKLKEELAEKKAAYEQNIEKFREGRDVKTYRDRVMKRVRDLQDMLITNSDKKHIPEMLKEPLGNFLMSLDTSSATKLKGKGETKADADMYRRTELLKQALERARNNTDSGSYLDLPDEFMERIEELSGMIHEITGGVDAVADSPINLMNSSQLKDLNFVLRTLQHSINSMNKMLATARFQTVAQAAESTITELDQILEYQMKGKGAEALRGTINWKNTTPVYAFDRMGEAGKELFKAMWEAQGEFAFHTKEILETREGFVSDKQVRKWSQDVQTIQLSDNRSIRMTTAQMMAFYCLTKRQQALDHLKTGGIRISNIEYGRNHIQQARAYHLSADDIVKIANMVKGDAKRVADQLQQYMTERGSEWGNQISMARFGYRAFTEPVYFPIRTESSQIAKDTKSTQENSINRLLNMSFTKSTQPNASTSVVVDNIFDVFSAHMSDMAKYNAFALPVLDMIKWFDYNVQERLEDGVQKDHRAVKTSIESAYGKDALNYISTFLEDVNGANEGGRVRSASLSQKFISHYKASAVGANLRVAIQQPTSYWRAAAVLDPKYLAVGEKVMWHNAKKHYKEMSKYAGIATWKELGFRDFNVGRSVREQIAGTLSASAQAYDKVMDASMKLAALGDTWTWCRIWEACKAEVKATQKLSGEELMHATAERFNEVIARTQVVDSVMTRSHTMRSKNLLDQLMTPFMAEPTLSYNVVASSVFDYRTELRRSNGQVAWKKYGKKMIRAFGVFAVTAFWTGVFQSLADALRDDDDYEEFYKKFLDAMLPKGLPKWNFNEDPMKWIEEALDQGNLFANMNIASNIPGLHRELLNVLKGFGSEAMWTAGISNFYNAVAAVYEKIALEAGWMEEATDATWNGNMTWWGAIQKSLQSASQISSLPIYNLLRDATALYNTTVQEFFGRQDLKLLSYDPGTEGRIANAYADGFLTFDEAMGEMLKFGVSQDKAYETLMKSAGFGKYDELREAIVNGGDVNAVMEKLTGYGIKEDLVTNNVKAIIKDLVLGTEDEPPMIDKKTAKNLLIQYLGMTVPEAHYTVEAYGEENFSKYDDLRDAILNGGDVQAAMDELTEYGTKESDVLSEIRASIKVWYQGETKDDGTVVEPVIDKDRAVELLVQYGDRDEDEATELVTEWSLTVDTGVKDIKESFIAGDLTTDEAIDYRMTYYGQSEEDAAQTVAEWIFEDEYGFSYNDRIGQFKDGNLSADELVDVMVEYGGKTDAEAKASVAGYAKEAYADGQFTRDEALSVMTNSGGMTSDEADKRLRYIDVSAQFPDITVDDAWVNEYYEEVESSGISINVFIEYRNNVKDISGEGKKARRMDVINSMPISNAQKDALYYAEGWAASTIHEAPWR